MLAAGCSVEPRTQSIADGKARGDREALRDDLARLVDKVGLTPFEVEEWRLDELAGRLLTAGWRRVDDDATAADMVREFHEVFGLPINDTTRTLNKLRADLVREEAEETAEAIESGDLEHKAKELADLAYVVYGAALTFGIDLDVAVAEVHRSNLSKLVDGKPVMRADGKVLKGPNYRPPDMSRAVVRALREET